MRRAKKAGGAERRAGTRARVKVKLSACRALIPLDTAAVRAHYLRGCETCVAELLASEQARRQYDSDEEAFHRWLQLALGPLHTELNQAKDESHAAYVAYRQAQERAGIRPSRLEEMFDRLRGGMPCDDDGAEPFGEPGGPRGGADTDDHDDAEEEAELRRENIAGIASFFGIDRSDVEQRIKELYRGLCRALHPDAGGAVPDGMEWLWHEVQSAYHEGDVITLINLETRVQILQGAYRGLPTVGDVIAFGARVHLALQMIEKQLAELKSSPAWEFSQWTPAKKNRVLKEAERELQGEIAFFRRAAARYDEQRREMTEYEQRMRERAAQRQKEEEQRRRRYEQACAREGDTLPPRPRRRRGAAVAGDYLQPEFSF